MIGLSKKGDLKRILWILIVGMLLFGAFAGFLVFGETAEEEKLRLEAELAQLESDLSAIEGGRWVNYSCNVNQIFFNNYNCDNQIGYHTVKVLTEGIHNQRFNFSNQIADAHNLASVANVTTNGSVNQFIDDTDTDFLKGNLSLNVSIAGTGAGANVTLKPFGEITANASTVLLMHFNNDTGTGESASLFLDNSTYGNNGTCSLASNQCPIFNESNAKYGRAALEFDGLDDYFNISNSTKGKLSMGNSSFTVEAWVKPKNNIPNAINPMYITSQYCTGGNCPTAGFTWSVTQSGTVRIVFGRGSSYSLYTNKTISAGEWSHIAVNIVKVAAQSKAYINGISVNYTEQKPEDITNDISLIGTTNNNTAVGQINLEVDGGGSFFNGTMDELAIWNGSLSSDIIAMHAGYVIIGNFTSQVFDANKSVQWSYISWYQGADEKGVSNLYQQDLSNVINASTVLYMKFNNDTLESERQLNVTHNISAETNLVLYMPFDSANAKELKENGSTVLLMHFNNRSDWGENDTFFVDNSTLFNNGTCNLASSLCPSVNTTDFKFGRASLTFDGTNDFVNVSSLDNSTDLPSTLTTYSFETWFKGFGTSSGTTPATIGIRDSTGGNGIFLVVEHRTGASPGISVNIRDNANTLLNPITDVGDKLTDRNWHHEAVVRDGNTVRTYLDGALISTASATLGNIGWNQALIGSNNVGSIFNGSLDEVAIWNVSLSSQIIAQHSGYGIDRSIYGNNASLMNGSVINFTGKFQEAMQFDAFNDYVEIKDSDDWGFGTDDFAIEMWVNSKVPVVSANIYNLISQSESAASNYWSFRKNDDANLKWRFEANPGPSLNGGAETTMLEIGRWYHMAVTRVGGTLTIYQNGIAIASGSGATSMPNLNAPLHIGFRRNVVGDFNGTMDEVVIWKNKTLSADKIAEHAGAKIIDYSQYGNNGTRNFNSTSDFGRNFTDGKFSKALQFDGVNDFVNVTNITGLNLNGNAATLEAWVNPRAITGPPHTIIRKDLTGSDGGYFFDFSNEDNIRFSLGGLNGGNPLASTQSPTVDEWNHIAGTYDGSAMRIFLNGVQIASVATSGSITTGPDTTIIGNDEGLTTPVNGTIDELSIWNVSLSADEIRKHYEKGVLKLNLSYRTSQDNVTFTAWTSVGNNTLSAITSNAINRYFQYKADFNTTDARYTPILNNVSINYTIRSNLTIFDDTELRVVIANERFNFTANFTDFVKPINGTNINCTISLNSTGSYAAPIKMNFTSQNKYYYYETSFSNKTIASFNVTCDGTALGHRLMRTIDAFNVTVARVSNFNGTTTDYNNLAAFDNISNAILEIVGFGRITWLNTINITGADLNKNINISQNNIGLFPENLHRTLNTSANITIYNVQSLVSPRILRNNVTCPESICTLISYNGTAITFNVTSFSNHSVTNGTLNITVNLNNTLVSAGTPILVSGKANLSNGTNVSNNLIRLFVDGTEQGIGLNFIDNSDADFNKSTNLNATRVRGTGSNANVTLADWDYDPDGNLSVNLTAYWKFDEPTSSNNRSDYKGNNNLATNSTITRVDGVREGAANFTRTRQQYLNISNNTDLSVGGNISFTIAAWVFLDSEDVMYAVSKHNNVAGDMEWFLRFDGGTDTDKFRFQVVEGATTNKDVTSTTTVTNGTWYFLVAWYDDDANTINLQVDNSVVDTTTGIGALNFTGSPFRIGAFSRTPSNFWDGRIDEVAFWKRILTQKERNVLYNGTNASSYPYLSGNTFKPYKGNFTSQIFDAGRTVNFSYISWYQGADDKGVSAGYQQDLGGLVNASTVLYMKFNNDTLESERQLNVTHNISAETNLVLYMPFDSASARELTANASTVLLMHFNNVSPENYNMSNTTLIYDNSSYGNNGTLFLNTSAGNFTPNGGRFGGAFVFDGRDDFINITSLRGFSNGTNASTIEAWFKADGFPDGRTTIAGYGQDSTNSQRSFYLGIGTSGTDRVLKIRTNGDDTGGNTIVSTNTWYHAAVVDDGTNMKLYLNGILDASVARVGSGKLAEEAFIGRIDPGMGEAFFNGTIDEVAIWNVSLSSAIIAQHSGYGIDRSIYGNNATLMFNTTVNQSGKFGEAMQFGGNGFVNVTQSSNWNFSTRDYAIEFWVKFRGFVNNVIMVDLGGDTNIETRVQYDNVNKKFVVYRGGDLVVNTDWTASTDTWYHVAASVSSNNVRGYIDGSQIGTGSNTRPVNNTQNLIIGAFRNANGNFVNGTMDEVAIWNKTLSSDLIAQHAGAKIVDYSNYGNNGTRNFNSTSDFGRNFTDGKFSKALLFDGKNDWINVTNASGLNIIGNSITMEAWVYPITMTTNKAGVFRKNRGGPDGGFIFDIDTDDGLRMVLNVSGTQTLLTTAGIPQNNVWSHVAGTYDGTTMRLYLNGVQVASQASSGSIGVSDENLIIGNDPTLVSPFNGTIDEVAIWNVSLSSDEIRKHYEKGVLKLNLSYRTSNDSTAFSQWTPVPNNTLSTVGFSIADDSLIDVVEGVVVRNEKIKESGFLNMAEECRSTDERGTNNYLNVSILNSDKCKAAEAQHGRAPSSQLGVLSKYMRVQNSQRRVESPVRGALKTNSDNSENVVVKNVNESAFFTFSSSRNLSFLEGNCDFDIISSSSEISSIVQGCLDMLLCERCYEACNYLFNRHACFQHLQNLPDHDSGAFESGLAMADFAVRNDVFVDFDSHDVDEGKGLFKGIENQRFSGLPKMQSIFDSIGNQEIIPIDEFKKICPTLDCNVVDYITAKKKIKDIKEGDIVLSLDENSGKLKPAKVNALLDHGIKPIFELKTISGRAINTTAEHPYLVKLYDKALCDKYANTFWNKINEKEENGFHSQAIAPNQDLIPSRTNTIKQNLFKYLSVENEGTKLGSHSLASRMRVSSFKSELAHNSLSDRGSDFLRGSAGSNSLSNEMNLPPDACESLACSRHLPASKISSENEFEQNGYCTRWVEASELNEGMEIAAPRIENDVNQKEKYNNNGVSFNVPVLGSTLKPRDSNTTTPINTLSMISDIKTRVTSSLPLIFIRASPSFNLIIPPPDSTSLSAKALISSLSANSFGSTVKVAPVSTKALTFSECFLSKSNISASTHECPINTSNNNDIFKDIVFEKIASINAFDKQHVYDLSIEGTKNFIANDIIAHNTARYFQYKADFNTTDAKYSPILNNVTINYSGIFTDAFGRYNFTITAGSTAKTYEVKANTTFEGLNGQQNNTFRVTAIPVINRNFTIPTFPRFGQNVTFVVNVTDADNNILYINFTLKPANGSIINLTNGTRVGDLHNVSFNLTNYGTWFWNISLTDADGFIVNMTGTGEIILMQITVNLNATLVPASSPIAVSGHINLSNGSNVSNNVISIFVDGTEQISLHNFTDDTDTDFNAGTFINVSVQGTGTLANLTLNKNESGAYPNMTGNFTSQTFNAGGVANWSYISWTDVANNKYGQDLGDSINASMVLYMKFNNDTLESERQLNVTHNISAETNLVLYMPFDSAAARELTQNASTILLLHFNNRSDWGENNTFFVDNSTYKNNGNCTGTGCPAVNTTNYKFGGAALTFDGINDYVNISDKDSLDAVSAFNGTTVEAWVYVAGSPTATHQVVYKSNAYFLSVLSDDTVRFLVYEEPAGNGIFDATTTTTINRNEWHHLAGTFDGSNGKVYIDGALAITDSVDAGERVYQSNTFSLMIGSANTLDAFFNGTIDEVAIWNLSLSSGDIAKHSGYGIDRSIYGNNATVINGTTVNFTSFKFGEAMTFGTDNDFVRIKNNSLITFGNGVTDKPFSIEAWVNYNPSTARLGCAIAAKSSEGGEHEYILNKDGDDRLFLILYNRTGNSAIRRIANHNLTSLLGNWIHVVSTYDGSSSDTGIKLYLNGVQLSTTSASTAPYVAMTGSSDLLIGRWRPDSCNVTIDEFAIWNTTLTPDKISEHAGAKIVDYSQYGNNGTRNFNSTSDFGRNFTTNAKFGKALVFDGVNDYVNVTDLPSMNALTLEVWINPSDVSTNNVILGHNLAGNNNGDVNFIVKTDGKLYFLLSDGTSETEINTNTILNTNTWYYTAATYSGSTMTIYLNGLAEVTGTISNANPFAFSGNPNVGGDIDGKSNFFNGTIDELSIWNVSIESSLIAQHAQRGLTNLSIYYSASNDSTTWSDWTRATNNTLTAVGFSIADDSLVDVVDYVVVRNDVINDNYSTSNNLLMSSVDNISISDCSLNLFSLDQIAQSEANANAKYGISLECPANNFKALDSNFLNSDLGTTSVISDNKANDIINSKPPMPQNLQILCLSLYNSSSAKSGTINLAPLRYADLSKFLVKDSGLKNENKTLASTTINLICNAPNYGMYLLAKLSLYSSTSSEKLSSVSLLFFNISSTALNKSNILSFSSTALLNNDLVADLLSSSPIISLNLSGISILNSAILISPKETNENAYLKVVVNSKDLKENNEKEENQARSLDKTSVWRTEILNEFFVDSETTKTHTVSSNKQDKYKNLSVLDSDYSIIPIDEFKQICPSIDCGVVDYITTKKKIKDVKEDDYVLSLDEKTGKIVPAKVNALLDHGIKPIFELKTISGRAINTTAEHPYLVKLYDKALCDKYANTFWNRNTLTDIKSTITTSESIKNNEFDEKDYCTRWVEVSELKKEMEIAVPYYKTGAVKWEKIAFITTLDEQHVYDLAIEGTQNFIANDIIAHNTARYFRYLAKFNTSNSNLSPILNDVTINYTGIFTDNFGNYNYTFNAPTTATTYTVKVNATSNNIPGEALTTFRVTAIPVINTNFTIPTFPMFNRDVTIVANVTDADNTIVYVNFTLYAPNGSIINLTNSSRVGDLHNASFNLTSYGTWRWNITVFDSDGFLVNSSSTGEIILMQITENFNVTATEANASISVSGHVNLSNGTNVSDSLISIFFNEVLMGINNLTPVGNYKQKQFVDDSDSDFLKGNLSINSRVVGTGAGANVTINISSLQNQTQNIQQRGITVNASTILYLRFEEGTGQYANDSSQYGNNGTFGATTASASDDPVWNSSAKFGSFGVSFNTNDFVNISDSNSLDVVGNLSIEAWIKPNSLSASGRAMLVDKADYPTANDVGYTIFLDPSGSNLIINGFIANSGGSCQITGTQAFTSNEWHHVAFTYDGVRGRTYVDGLTDTDSACTQSPAANAVHLTVGMTSDARNFYNGTIDEVGIWNISLDNATILQHYQLGWGYFNTSNFTSQVFDANAVVNWSYISWYQGADDKGISNLYQQDLSNVINASTVLYMKFNNDTLESERQLNATHNISAETNLVLYMPFDSANARELKENGSTVLLMHFNNDTGTGENASLFLSNATFSNVTNGTCNLASGFCPVFNKSNARLGAAALEFDGVDDVVNTTFKPKNMLGTNKSFSISLWTFLKSAKNQNFIHTPVGDGGDRFYFIVDTGTYIIGLGSQFKDTGIVPVTGFWQHLVVTWNGSSSLKLYVDGALRKEESYTGDGQPANGNMVIGASASDGSLVINGTIDEVAIWNISLSSGDIAKHSGYGIDRSIYGNNATLMNGTIVNQSGKFFEAMQFDGKGDFVNLSNDSDFNFGTGEFAVEFWMKTTDTSDNSLIDKSISESPFSGWYFYFRGAGDIDFFANNDANTLDGKIKTNDGNWHHITATRRGTTSYLYVDAVLDVSAAHSSNDNTAAALLIGTQRSSALFFNGTMDEVAIWNKSLSSDLIAQHAGAKIIDYSQYGNNGTRNFNSSSDFGRNFTDGKFSKALLFDAINDYVNVSDSSSLDINNSLTIEAWVKFDGLPNDNMNIVSKGDTSIANYNYNIRTNLAQLDYAWKCCGTTDNVYRTTSSVLTTGVWTHIAATHVSGNTPKIYINGIEQSASITSGAATTPLNYSADHLYIGSRGRNEASGAFVNGTIDEVAIWNISLSESEIRKHYEKGVLKLNLSYRTSNDSTTFSQWYGAGNNTLSTVGLCVAEDSLITLANGSKKKIKEIQEGEYVQSLDEKTGKIVTNKVNALLDMGNKTVYQLTTESGRAINTTKEHPYLIRIYKNSNSSGRSLITLPSISSGECCFSNLEIERFCASKSFARILNSQIPKCLEEANCSSVKCLSRVISNLCSDKVSSNTSPFSIPLGDNLTSCPNLDKKENKPLCTFSSNKNFILGRDKFETSFCELSSKLQSCFDVLFNQGRVCFKDFFCSSSIFEHFQNYRNHDSCTFESRLSMANIGINNDIIINFDSHEINNDSSVFKYYENNSASLLELKDELIEINNVTAKWVRVNQLKKGMEIAVPDYESNTIKWEKIVSINVLEPQHVYDLSIEGTKNFIANDIIAHNTGRYFQYKADFNTTDARYSPILNNVTINYSGIFTDAFGNYNYTFRAPSSGSYSIKVNATYANISGEAFTTLQIDTSAPRINFTRPTPANNSRAVGNAQKINISITDNAVSRCTLQVHNGTDNATNFTMEIRGLNCNVTITTLDGYNYTLKAYATDTAGNENSTENHTFRENTKPEIPTLNAPANNSRLLTTSVILNYTTNDNDTDNVNYIVYFDTSTNPTTIVYRSTSKTFVVSTTRGTTYFWKVQADDTFENSSNSTIRQFTINSLPPTPLIITPNLTGIQLRGSQTYNVSWVNSTSDAEGDQVNISLYYSTDSGLTYPNFITSNLTNNGTYGWLVPSIDSNKARIKAIATDSYETSEDTSDNDFTIDSTAPTITLDNPPNGSSFNNGTFINLTITDNLVGGINVSWNNNSYVGAPNRTDFNGTYDINTTDWQVGEVNISVYANDSVGNLATAYFRFSITDVQPVVTFNAPSPNQVIRATFRVNVSSTSQLDDAAFVNFTYEGATQNFTMTQAGNDYFYDFDTTTVADRQRRLSVYGNNSAGTVVRADIFATIDNTAPAIRLDSPANDTWKNSSVTFVYVPNDVTTSIVNCSLIINGTINRTNSSISEGIENLFSNVVFGDGIYRWDVNCTDTIGNNGSNGTARLLKIDTIIPTITLLDPPNDTSIRGNKTINFSVTDSGGAGIANLTWSSNYLLDQTSFIGTYGINTSEFPEGKTNITIVANDSAGNKVTLVLTYIIDITPPLVTFNKPSPRQVVRGIFRVNITATDALSNVSSLLFAFNGSSNFTMNRTSPEVTSDYFFDWNTTNASDKEYVLKIFGNDTAGNIKFEPRLAIVDNTAPAIRLDSPSNNTFSKTRLNTFTFTVSELNNLNNCTLLINGSINSTITSPIKGENSFSVNLNDALYRWTVNCSDEAVDVNGTKNVGTNSTELLISIDTVNPQINMSVNDTSIVQGDVVNVTANVSDNIGLSFCQFVINETGSKQFFNKSVTGTGDQCSQNFTLRIAGTANFTVIVNDTANNLNQSERIVNVSDITPPQINMSLNDTIIELNEIVNVTANISDNIGLSFCQFIINQTGSKEYLNKSISGANDQCSQIFNITLDAGNVINFTVIVNDTANNKNQSEIIATINDTTSPILESISLSSTSITSGSTLKLRIKCIDNSSNLAQINFTLQSPTGKLLNRSSPDYFTIPSVKSYILNYTIFEKNESSEIGTWNVTAVGCKDNYTNSIYNTTTALTFTVTSAPSPAPSAGAAGAGAGGGGGAPFPVFEEEKVKEFSLSTISIKEQLALGIAKTRTITIKNTGKDSLSFNLNVVTVNDFVFLSDTSFSLNAGEEKTIEANIIGKKLGSYFGDIEITADGIKKTITVIVEVESEQVLFDAKIDIPSAYKEVQAGDDLKAQITLLNVGPPRKVDVTTTYIIKDKLGNIVYEGSETFAVEKQTSFVKSFKIPTNLQPGDYLAIIEVRYADSFAVSSELFRVVPEEETIVEKAVKSNKVIMSVLIIFVGLTFLFVYLLVPKVMIPKVVKLENTLNKIKGAIARNDIESAKKMYIKARKIYMTMKIKDKKSYKELIKLYNKLR